MNTGGRRSALDCLTSGMRSRLSPLLDAMDSLRSERWPIVRAFDLENVKSIHGSTVCACERDGLAYWLNRSLACGTTSRARPH